MLLDDENNIKIADFGFAEISPPGSKLKKCPGTLRYLAPEILIDGKNCDGRKKDIWALGVILLEFVSGDAPFKGKTNNEVIKKIHARDFT